MNTRNLTLFPLLLIFYTVTTYLSNDMYIPALLALKHDFNASNYLAQLTLTSWFLGSASSQLVMGPISDHYGRRPVLLFGGFLFVVSTIICAITHHISVLLIARFIQGSAVCSLMVAGYATVHELYDSKRAIHILALIGSIGILAPAFGPLAGGLALKIASWRFIFWLLGVLAIIALSFLFKEMPETNPIKNRSDFNFKKLIVNYLNILINRKFILSVTVFCLVFSGMIAWLVMGPLLITEVFHYSPLMFGFFQAVIFSGFILGNLFVKYTLDILSVNKIIFIGLSIAVMGAILSLITTFLFPEVLIAFIISLMIYSAGTALAFGTLQRVAIEACDEPMGLRMAIFSTMMGVAAVSGSAIAGIIYNGSTDTLAYFLGVVAVLAFFINLKRYKVCLQFARQSQKSLIPV